MQALPSQQTDDPAASPIAAFLVSYRIWVYLALLLLALAVIVVDDRGSRPSSSSAAPGTVVKPHRAVKPAPPTEDDRPLLLPDR